MIVDVKWNDIPALVERMESFKTKKWQGLAVGNHYAILNLFDGEVAIIIEKIMSDLQLSNRVFVNCLYNTRTIKLLLRGINKDLIFRYDNIEMTSMFEKIIGNEVG